MVGHDKIGLYGVKWVFLFLPRFEIKQIQTTTRQNVSPRHYPMPFARAMVDIVEQMKAARRGCPQLPEVVPPFQEVLTWDWLESDVWQCAGLDDLYKYLRGASALKIPQDLKRHFPKEL